ncbi:MAG TPA: hypothetical protein VJP85_04660 [Candidatus Baltobacteraceae bacterium]|nr:hypothetical protein [Candidatus Baltobacteraceae bacterium]
MQQPQQPKSKRKKQANTFAILTVAAACAAAAVGAGPQPARAIVVPTPPPQRGATPVSTPTVTPNATILPLDSSLFFVLDDAMSSREKPGTVVRAHLRDPIVLQGRTIAAAGTPVEIELYETTPAHMGNEDGSIDIYFRPLTLADGKSIPLTTPTSHIDPRVSVGQYNTRATVDTVGDIFIPGHFIYHMLRKGHDVTLGAGTVLRARTGASVMLSHSGLVVATPQPFLTIQDTPHPGFSPAPMYTPPGFHLATPKPSPSVKSTSTP